VTTFAIVGTGWRAEYFWRLAAAFLVDCRREQTRRAYFNDLRAWYAWCTDRDLHPLQARRHDIALWARQLAERPRRSGKVEAPVAVDLALVRDALGVQSLGPEGERLLRGHARDDPVHHPGARAARDGVGVLEEGQLGAGTPLLVGVEEVVDAGIVLVDRLGHQAQAEDARVEVDVERRVAGDRGDVVDALEPHGP